MKEEATGISIGKIKKINEASVAKSFRCFLTALNTFHNNNGIRKRFQENSVLRQTGVRYSPVRGAGSRAGGGRGRPATESDVRRGGRGGCRAGRALPCVGRGCVWAGSRWRRGGPRACWAAEAGYRHPHRPARGTHRARPAGVDTPRAQMAGEGIRLGRDDAAGTRQAQTAGAGTRQALAAGAGTRQGRGGGAGRVLQGGAGTLPGRGCRVDHYWAGR